MKYQNKVNYGAAVKSLYPALVEGVDYIICNLGDYYQDILWKNSLDQPQKSDLDIEISNLKKLYYSEYRQKQYPSTEEWMRAYLQKELDGQFDEWNSLVQKRQDIKQRYPK
jgi:hypothetical protein